MTAAHTLNPLVFSNYDLISKITIRLIITIIGSIENVKEKGLGTRREMNTKWKWTEDGKEKELETRSSRR